MLRAATVAGVRHRLDGRRGEDAYAWSQSPECLVVAVADGVSATPQAALAAQAAVRAAVDTAAADSHGERPHVQGELPGAGAPGQGDLLAQCCATAMAAAALAVTDAVRDLTSGATTLVVAALSPDRRWAASRVGDSDAFVLDAAGWLPVFPSAGEEGVRTGATDALPGPTDGAQTMSGTLAEDQVLVLLSDGVGGPLRDGPSTVALGLAQGLMLPPTPLELARLVDFARQGCHDDRTLVAVWPAPAGVRLPPGGPPHGPADVWPGPAD